MFRHVFSYTLKILLRRKGLVFWSLIFPIILGLLFKLSLGNLINENVFEVIPVSVEKDLYQDGEIKNFLDKMEEEDLFKVTPTEGNRLLEEDKVKAHIKTKDEILIKESNVETTIVVDALKSYQHIERSILRILKENPGENLSDLLKNKDHVVDQTNPKINIVNTYFYTLVGMQAIYGYMWGMNVIYSYEANLSTAAKRNFMAPIKRRTRLLTSLLVAWMINVVILGFSIGVLSYFLEVGFSERILPMLGLLLLAGLCGVAFGTFLGVAIKGEKNRKEGMGISITMAMSFLAGMMISSMKILIQRHAPLINKLNPVALITDGLYALYYYPDYERYIENMIWLSIVTFIFILGTVYFTRGKSYEHL